MRSFKRWCWGLLAALCLAGAPAAQAGVLGAAQARQVRAVVEAQLAAFAADDAERAYSFAAPNVRRLFPNPGLFMAMVRSGYPVVYRPASVAFLKPERGDDGSVIQAVQMTNASGDMWLAVYRLQRQPGKAWRISGCAVERNEGHAT